jgi:16S rRNA processing protein RimM
MLHGSSRFVIGRINGVFGTRGWLKIYSYTRPRENVLTYTHWQLSQHNQSSSLAVLAHRQEGSGLVALLEGIHDRDKAVAHVGAEISVDRASLPDSAPGEYYWADLIGLEVVNKDGIILGKVLRLLATGANDVLVLDGPKERLIPYVQGHYVLNVDLDARRMTIDWHEDD